MKKIATLLFLTLLIASCGQIFNKFKFRSSQNPQSVSGLFNADQLNLKVYYESGAEPYVGGPLPSFKYWDLAQKNLEALFVGKDKAPSISVPKELNEMSQLSSYNKATWSAQEVSLIHISEPTRRTPISYAVFC